jgi:hypothetical protein
MMPRRPNAYREALSALSDTHSTLIAVLTVRRLPASAREQIMLLVQRLAVLLMRDNGRSR